MNKGIIHFMGLFGGLGGTERATLEEMLMMRECGFDVVYTCITPMQGFKEVLMENNIPWKSCDYKSPLDLMAFWKLWKRLKDIKSVRVILIAHNVFAMICILLQGKRNTSFMRHHYHHFGIGTISPFKWLITYVVSAISIRNIAYVCDYIRQEAIRILPLLKNKSCVIHNIFQMESPVCIYDMMRVRASLGIAEHAFVIGGAGRFETVKRWDIWVNVLTLVLERDMNSVALVVGGGSQSALITKLVEQFPGRVIFPGLKQNMGDFYTALDVLLFISDFDSTPRVPMEALSFGKPAVVSLSKGGLGEIFPKNIMPYFEKHNLTQIVDAVLKMRGYKINREDIMAHLEKYSMTSIRKEYLSWLKLA